MAERLPWPTASQVEAACLLEQYLPDWARADVALTTLHERVPGFGPAPCLLKTVAVNSLYGTRVLASLRMADHICRTLAGRDTATAGPDLVETLASIPAWTEKQPKRHVSFASKFCHFFVSPERFPIYDDAVCRMVQLHLGRDRQRCPDRPYVALVANLAKLREQASIDRPHREFDRYLWIAGMFAKSLKSDELNVQMAALFERPSPEAAELLKAALPDGWWPVASR